MKGPEGQDIFEPDKKPRARLTGRVHFLYLPSVS